MLIEVWHHVLKFKFLLGKRNRRLDHLIHTRVDGVLPYYALKQRRQDLGFEGLDIEVKKRRDIVERSKTYTRADIQHLGDGAYLVQSQSDPIKVYEIDLDTYTCTCFDFPLISYCKHICAVQELFEEHEDAADRTVHSSPQVPSLSTLNYLPQTSESAVLNLEAPKPRVLAILSEKLERLAVRLRRPRMDPSNLPLLDDFVVALDSMLADTDNGTVLPSSQHLMPNAKEAGARNIMMPGVKTRRTRAGDPAYGAGVSSGGKVMAKKAKKSTQHSTVSPASQLPPLPPPLLLLRLFYRPLPNYTHSHHRLLIFLIRIPLARQ
ncbi:hypothetical protein B0H17DRAFT_1197358 [Mycena rosella]|uniref:SWIM-type domain-containing protein n=1 Tax=Mycena rosella TaxID=1033263 RepID=A0AAD7GNR5_MYCRO|nr:hypothetical protein B0H17DRAFT_1197358 [Mycena rosella]